MSSILGAVGSAVGSVGSSLLNTVVGSSYSDKNNKDSQARSQNYSYWNTITDYILNRAGYKSDMAVNYDYAVKRDEDQYALAKRYAENSASWQKTGMENANINPILAYNSLGSGVTYDAANMSSGTGSGSNMETPSSASPSAGSGHGIDLASIARDVASTESLEANTKTTNEIRDSLVASAKQDYIKKQAETDVERARVDVTEAQAAKIRADAQQTEANTAKTLVDALNARENSGNPTVGGFISRIIHPLGDKASDALESIISRHVGGIDDKSKDKQSKEIDELLKTLPSPVIEHSGKRSGRSLILTR